MSLESFCDELEEFNIFMNDLIKEYSEMKADLLRENVDAERNDILVISDFKKKFDELGSGIWIVGDFIKNIIRSMRGIIDYVDPNIERVRNVFIRNIHLFAMSVNFARFVRDDDGIIRIYRDAVTDERCDKQIAFNVLLRDLEPSGLDANEFTEKLKNSLKTADTRDGFKSVQGKTLAEFKNTDFPVEWFDSVLEGWDRIISSIIEEWMDKYMLCSEIEQGGVYDSLFGKESDLLIYGVLNLLNGERRFDQNIAGNHQSEFNYLYWVSLNVGLDLKTKYLSFAEFIGGRYFRPTLMSYFDYWIKEGKAHNYGLDRYRIGR